MTVCYAYESFYSIIIMYPDILFVYFYIGMNNYRSNKQ